MTSMQSSANSKDYVAFHAAERPDAVALLENGRAISYAEVSRDLAKSTSAIRELGIERGGRIAVGCESTYIHWLLLAACEHLGIATASYDKSERGAATLLLSGMDLVLAEPGFGTTGGRRSHVITSDWVEQVLARPDAPPIAAMGAPE